MTDHAGARVLLSGDEGQARPVGAPLLAPGTLLEKGLPSISHTEDVPHAQVLRLRPQSKALVGGGIEAFVVDVAVAGVPTP